MDIELLQQLDTVQKYIGTLFDSLPQININMMSLPSDEDIKSIVQQNIDYGKKIIELSDKFTAKYRKDHFVDRKDVEEKIVNIYKIVCPHVYCANLDEMVAAILRKLEESHAPYIQGSQSRSSYGQTPYLNINSRTNSVGHTYNLGPRDSKIDQVNSHAQLHQARRSSMNPLNMPKSGVMVENLPLQPSQIQLTDPSKRKRSMNKSKVSRKSITSKQKQQDSNFTAKNVLQIKAFFQQQENQIRKIFQRLNQIIQTSNSLKISQQNKQFTKCSNESEKDTLKDFIEAHIQNNKQNLNKMYELINIIDEHFGKRNKHETYAQGKFNTYIQEINKRQEVFSFTVSKMLEHISNLKDCLQHKVSDISERNHSHRYLIGTTRSQSQKNPMEILQSLQQISNNFYDLYPSHSIIKDLKIQPNPHKIIEYDESQMERRGFKNQQIQVCIIKPQNQKSASRQNTQSKKNLLQLFRTGARINEMIEKFERTIKFKKSIELKEIEKFIETIRESLPKKNTANLPTSVVTQVQGYQQQLRKIIETNERNQKQLAQECNKKVRRYEKQIQELQKSIQQLVEFQRKEQQKMQSNNRKLSKKLDAEKEESKKMLAFKASLEKNMKQMSMKVTRLQNQIRQQSQKFELTETNLINQNRNMQRQLQYLKQQNAQLIAKSKQQSVKMEEQREIYQQKIIFLETQQQSKSQEFLQTKYELQEMIKQNTLSKKQVEELTEIYEDKIKELDELIDHYKELELKLETKTLQNTEQKEKIQILGQKSNIHEKQRIRMQKEIGKLQQKLQEKEEQAEKLREIGLLNDSDIGILKQEMQKVKQAYTDSEEQIDELKSYILQLQGQRQLILRENKYIKREYENYGQKIESNQLNLAKLEKQLRESQDEVHLKKKELLHMTQQLQQIKRQLARVKKQSIEMRESNIKLEAQLRNVRQQLHKKTQNESLESGKRKLEMQAAKVELRRRTEQMQKMKETYEQKIEILESKNKQLSQFITQKQLLAKITNSHLSQ